MSIFDDDNDNDNERFQTSRRRKFLPQFSPRGEAFAAGNGAHWSVCLPKRDLESCHVYHSGMQPGAQVTACHTTIYFLRV